jgi:GNAT superfamily N-acetyltransferase
MARAEVMGHKGGPMWLVRDARCGHPAADAADALVLVGGFDDVVLGFAVVRRERLSDASALALIDALYVEPAARGVAIGEALMDEVVAWSTAHGCRGIDAVALPGDRATKNFFERFGLTARAIAVHRELPAPPSEP